MVTHETKEKFGRNIGPGRLKLLRPKLSPGKRCEECRTKFRWRRASEKELQRYLDYSRAYIGLDLPERWRFNVADRQPEIGMV